MSSPSGSEKTGPIKTEYAMMNFLSGALVSTLGQAVENENSATREQRGLKRRLDRAHEQIADLDAELEDRRRISLLSANVLEETVKKSLTDSLTGLPNREAFFYRYESASAQVQRSGKRASDAAWVVFIDADGFKNVNDTHGHQEGDEVLKSVASKLSNAVREQDTVARLGGDEFAVLLVGLPMERALEACETMKNSVAKDGKVTLSVGLSQLDHLRGTQDSIWRADQAMYAVKDSGGNKVYCYERLPHEVTDSTAQEHPQLELTPIEEIAS